MRPNFLVSSFCFVSAAARLRPIHTRGSGTIRYCVSIRPFKNFLSILLWAKPYLFFCHTIKRVTLSCARGDDKSSNDYSDLRSLNSDFLYLSDLGSSDSPIK